MSPRKPKNGIFYDGEASCVPEEYDDKGGGAFHISVNVPSLYDSKNVRKLIRWLIRAEKWINNKEKYKRPGRRALK